MQSYWGVDGWMDGWMDDLVGGVDGWMDGCMVLLVAIEVASKGF